MRRREPQAQSQDSLLIHPGCEGSSMNTRHAVMFEAAWRLALKPSQRGQQQSDKTDAVSKTRRVPENPTQYLLAVNPDYAVAADVCPPAARSDRVRQPLHLDDIRGRQQRFIVTPVQFETGTGGDMKKFKVTCDGVESIGTSSYQDAAIHRALWHLNDLKTGETKTITVERLPFTKHDKQENRHRKAPKQGIYVGQKVLTPTGYGTVDRK